MFPFIVSKSTNSRERLQCGLHRGNAHSFSTCIFIIQIIGCWLQISLLVPARSSAAATVHLLSRYFHLCGKIFLWLEAAPLWTLIISFDLWLLNLVSLSLLGPSFFLMFIWYVHLVDFPHLQLACLN